MFSTSKRRLVCVLLLCLICIIVLGFLYYIDTAGVLDLRCPTAEAGFYCTGCGITRAFTSLLNLDIYQAFRYNAYVVGLGWIYVYCVADLAIIWIKTNIISNKHDLHLILFVVGFILFGILRNFELFSFLAPTVV